MKPRIDPARRQLIEAALLHVAGGDTFTNGCKKVGLKSVTAARQTIQRDDELGQSHASAKLLQAEHHADKILNAVEQILAGTLDARSGDVAIRALQWTASKLSPQYGDKMSHVMSADAGFLEALRMVESAANSRAIESPIIDVTPEE
jgi:hypothetical protein